jgi:CxxC motif-containing protein (DUF1111 family)
MPGDKSLALILMGISATLGWGAPEARSDVQISDQLGGQGTRPLTTGDAFSFQMANSPREHQRPFSFGNRLFNTNWVEAPASVKSFDGLGPLFNRVSCSGCHTKDGRGQPPASGNGPMDQMLLRLSVPGIGKDGGVKPHPIYGDQLKVLPISPIPRCREVSLMAKDSACGHLTTRSTSWATGRWEMIF